MLFFIPIIVLQFASVASKRIKMLKHGGLTMYTANRYACACVFVPHSIEINTIHFSQFNKKKEEEKKK